MVRETRFYDLLGVSPNANQEDIKRAYKKMVRLCISSLQSILIVFVGVKIPSWQESRGRRNGEFHMFIKSVPDCSLYF